MKKKKPKFVDDGRTIANMNVDGMPWYDRSQSSDVAKTSRKDMPKEPSDGTVNDEVDYKSLSPAEKKEYRKETNAIIRGVIRQFMPYLLLFVGVGAIVILILWAVWR